MSIKSHCICQLNSRSLSQIWRTRKCLHGSPQIGRQWRSLRTFGVYEQQAAEIMPRTIGDTVLPMSSKGGIREQLKRWQSENGLEQLPRLEEAFDERNQSDISNDMTRLASQDDFRSRRRSDDEEEVRIPTSVERLDEEDGAIRRQYLRRGDLVELGQLRTDKSDRDNQLAIFVQEFDRQSQFYTMRGKWIHRAIHDIRYSFRSFVEPAMVDEVLPYIPDHEVTEEELDQAYSFELSVPREVGAKLVERMVEFWKQSETAYREHASTLDNAHRMLAHRSDLRFGHIQRIARKLVAKNSALKNEVIPEPTIYAVHKALNRSGFAFSFDKRSHESTGVFQIRPIQQVETVEKVQRWLRAYQEDMTRATHPGSAMDLHPDAQNIQSFVQKATYLIQHSRQTREATKDGNVGPSQTRLPIAPGSDSIRTRTEDSHSFTEADQSIIRFMEAWASSQVFYRHPRLCALGPVVLRATGQYQNLELNAQTGFMFLQEIGVLLPFENRVKYDEHLLLPHSQHSQVLERLNTRTEQDDSEMKDSMQDLRQQWDEPVFTIDSSSTHEIDDGVSVERIPQSLDEFWIHVHIANPTAFFSRDHLLAKIAGHMTETVYMPERNYLMLPAKFSIGKFSLESRRCALTFSARINSSGEILDKKITPTVLNRVVSATPQDCEMALGHADRNLTESSISVGGKVPKVSKKHSYLLNEGHIQDLRLLVNLTQARRTLRVRNGALSFHVGEPEFKVYNRVGKVGLGHATPYRHSPRFVDGDPVIQMLTNPYRSTTSFTAGGSQTTVLVEECMLLASEISAGWCLERNIPIIYRGLGRRSDSADPQAFYEETVRPLIDTGAGIPLHLALRYLRLHGQVIFDTNAIPHQVLGLPYYTRITSPLRRYGDLIAHWQIEAALREEAKAGKPLIRYLDRDDQQSPKCLPFSRADIDLIIQRLQPRERLIRRAKSLANSFWFSMLVWRAWKYHEAELPTTFQVLVYRSAGPGMDSCSVLIKEWGATAFMMNSRKIDDKDIEQHREGDWWEARLHSVDVYSRKVSFEPIRLLSRELGC